MRRRKKQDLVLRLVGTDRGAGRRGWQSPEGDLRLVESRLILALGVAVAFLDSRSPSLLVLGELLARVVADD
ncbi:hypothetical protein EUGRSUZ_J01309 [Eucalyptus grandis]|uniref:Uncharacterized protein n=2 Tax=Eucalyptus grandis TaxID=71139 RepID=A0ACC3JZV7_EUCGR|nr:hypothetical protein EUGRSUZ_J01309 [Eucalyptus grandis]